MTDSIEVSDDEYRTQRLADLAVIPNQYPHKFKPTVALDMYRQLYDSLKPDEIMTSRFESVAGRIQTIRIAGSKLYFAVIESDGITLQVLANANHYDSLEAFATDKRSLRRGDIIGVCGYPTRSSKGELSILPKSVILLAPCLHSIPKDGANGFTDDGLRFKQRYLDMIVHPEVRNIFKTRAKVNRFIRSHLDALSYIEIETPILSTKIGGANARPFKSFHNDLNREMYMRISPELYLKKLVIGGLERIYELGKQFRNESLDCSHNTEFSSIEIYSTYSDYQDMLKITEELFSGLAVLVHGSYKFDYDLVNHSTGEKKVLTLDFTPPFQQLNLMSDLEKFGDFKFPPEILKDLGNEESRQYLIKLCEEKNVKCSDPKTVPRLLDKLIGEFLEPLCMERPTFIMNHFQIMSPLAKHHRDNPIYTERFELFIVGFELANAYSELNNPKIQQLCFEKQAEDKVNGDVEAQDNDLDYVKALEYGLPCCGGLGIGIDRLVMLLTNKSILKEVLTFLPY